MKTSSPSHASPVRPETLVAFHRAWRECCSALRVSAALLLLMAAVAAQSAVVHLYLDPVNGVDAMASIVNPSGQTECAVTVNTPVDLIDPAQNAVLLHMPFPFKTINGPNGALASLPTLPYTSPVTGITWEYAIIHLMPGRYARGIGNYQHNGLIGNAEVFPIRLPNRVSIQGASALNTVFDMEAGTEGSFGPIFEFSPQMPGGNWGLHSFIDNVTMTGAWREEGAGAAKYATAVWLDPVGAVGDDGAEPTITNCFFYGNEVGIAAVSGTDGTAAHEATIVHNTFAWNQCGLWSGQILAPVSGSVGISPLVVLNNIFDASPPAACTLPSSWTTNFLYALPQSGFEGVDVGDMSIASVNYNAFEYDVATSSRKYDLTVTVVPGFPPTTTRSAPTFPIPTASRNIHAYTGGVNSGATRRGVLFIRDLICNGVASFRPSPTAEFDWSPHDFRLSPAVSAAGGAALNPPTALNPLVDNGWWGSFTVTMDNGVRTLDDEPGSLPGAMSWSLSSWQEDCDGYGNPRATNHPVYPDNGLGTDNVYTDIGADELGELIVVGARYQTTMFVDDHLRPVVPGSGMDNKYLWYLGAPTALAGMHVNLDKPMFRFISGVGSPPSGQYALPPWWSTWLFNPSSPYYQPTVADITPHLIPDIHPWWQQHPLLAVPSNPVWNACSNPLYNPSLFMSPVAGIMNPPGSYLGHAGFINFAWLDGFPLFQGPLFFHLGMPGNAFGGPWGPSGGSDAFSSFDAWCIATDSSSRKMETFLPTFYGNVPQPMTALRYTLEVPDSTTWTPDPTLAPLANSNMQSILVIVDGDQQPQSPGN